MNANLIQKTSEVNPFIKNFYLCFVSDGRAPFGIQPLGGSWRTYNRYSHVTDNQILKHLHGKYWLGVRGGFYPKYASIDLDAPEPGELEKVLSGLNLRPGQYRIFTSPSWQKDGSLHIYFKPRYNDEPPTLNLLRNIFSPYVRELDFELYPDRRRIFRLPFGKYQDMIDDETGAPLNYGPEENFKWLQKLDTFDLETINTAPELPFRYRTVTDWTPTGNAPDLLENGLQGSGQRHSALLQISYMLYRQNVSDGKAAEILKRWTRERHNGYSHTINSGRLAYALQDVDGVVSWTYDRLSQKKFYADTVQNIEAGITGPDLELIAEVFPGDTVNQKRLFNLLSYYRPRSFYDRVFIPGIRWQRICYTGLNRFKNILTQKGLMSEYRGYKPGVYSRSVKMALKSTLSGSAGKILPEGYFMRDNRNLGEYSAVLKALPPEYAKNRLKIPRKTLSDLLQSGGGNPYHI